MVVGSLAACLLIRMLNWFDSAKVSKSQSLLGLSFFLSCIQPSSFGFMVRVSCLNLLSRPLISICLVASFQKLDINSF